MTAEWVKAQEFENIFEKTLEMLAVSRDYIKSGNKDKEASPSPFDKFTTTKNLSQLTIGLTETTSWLLLNKAVHANETTIKELSTEGNRLIELFDKIENIHINEDVGNQFHVIMENCLALFSDVRKLHEKVATQSVS
ncbi:MAG: DUF1465 family protein [Alphaproteobacteria bacterium]|nr:DUF1465 family protein [Alphaproteobacteria bacterium]